MSLNPSKTPKKSRKNPTGSSKKKTNEACSTRGRSFGKPWQDPKLASISTNLRLLD